MSDPLVCRDGLLTGDACAEPKIFNFEWEPFSTSVAGVEVEANLFNVAPCAVLVNARGVKVCTHENIHLHKTCLMVEAGIELFSAAVSAVPVHGAVGRCKALETSK